jgi:hypothetical protein
LFVLPIYFLSVPHLHDPYGKLFVLDGIENSITTLANAVSLSACQFFMSLWSRISGERLYATKDFLKVFFRNGTKIFFNRFFEIDLIFGHLSSVS